jgi:hypothetical protein
LLSGGFLARQNSDRLAKHFIGRCGLLSSAGSDCDARERAAQQQPPPVNYGTAKSISRSRLWQDHLEQPLAPNIYNNNDVLPSLPSDAAGRCDQDHQAGPLVQEQNTLNRIKMRSHAGILRTTGEYVDRSPQTAFDDRSRDIVSAVVKGSA